MDTNILQNKNKLLSGLYIVATPLGNLGDITLRALETLKSCDYVICEDTRVTNKLLSHYGIKNSLLVYNDHSTEKDRNKILNLITSGKVVALVSDAGTPMVSDPGYKLVREAINQNIYVTSLPGPCAAITGLTISGFPSDQFFFGGFLPPKQTARKSFLNGIKDYECTLILYETSSRIAEALADIYDVMGEREIAVTRELTKKFEQAIIGKLPKVLDLISEDIKGEITLLITGRKEKAAINEDIELEIKKLMESGYSLSETVKIMCDKTGIKKKEIYDLALEIKGNAGK